MKKAIGLMEFKSIAKGIYVTDEMLKSADVEIIQANSVCPGKYINIVVGDVAAVNTAVEVGSEFAGYHLIGSHVISNVSEAIFPALTGTTQVTEYKAIGVVETMSALSAIVAADEASKASNVEILDLRIARGIGGKSFFILSGEVSSVNEAIQASINKLADSCDLIETTVIPSPSKDLLNYL